MMDDTILLVDDEEGILTVLSISLEDAGYHVYTARSGEEALQVFREFRPGIVLTDIKMPGMDGIDLLQRLKQENSDTEVIMITGHGDINLAIKSLKYEATDFITKPVNQEVLEFALIRARERIMMRRKLRAYTENLEQLVEEKTRKLIAAERLAAVGETVAGLSHAIKNIAGGLKGGMFVLEKGMELDNKTYLSQGWEMVRGNVDKIKNLSLDLLDYAKSKDLKRELCHPNDPPREAVDLMASRAEESGIRLEMELDPNLKPIRFDPEGLHRCLLNLITNAIDACEENSGGDEQKIVLVRTCKASGWGVEYQIVDNCCGMDKEILNKIFHGFFSTKGTKGTGIGLMTTQKIIDEHQGVIKVKSEPGQGATFVIRLPAS